MPLIQLKNIEKIYSDGTQALRGVSFDINKGEFTAIMGPSGSGKSTLLHIIGFLDSQTGGEYHFSDKTATDHSDEEIAKIRNQKMGFIFQSFNLLPKTTVLENVKLPLLYSDKKESSWNGLAMKAIKAVGLEHRADHLAYQLSGGEKQRAAIARALVNKPDVIFADEPTGNLDSKSGQMVMATIQKLNEEDGHTIILVTHETYTAEHASRIIHIIDGKVASDKQTQHRHHASKHFEK
ncbi:MAG: ABC transporter ATP-binding protein [Patescibacteria group bacterium]